MKVPTVHQLARAARQIETDERVPYAFEKRIMHRIGREAADLSAMLAKVMWRAAMGCLAITLLTGAWISLADPSAAELFASDLERTVLAPVDVEDTW